MVQIKCCQERYATQCFGCKKCCLKYLLVRFCLPTLSSLPFRWFICINKTLILDYVLSSNIHLTCFSWSVGLLLFCNWLMFPVVLSAIYKKIVLLTLIERHLIKMHKGVKHHTLYLLVRILTKRYMFLDVTGRCIFFSQVVGIIKRNWRPYCGILSKSSKPQVDHGVLLTYCIRYRQFCYDLLEV